MMSNQKPIVTIKEKSLALLTHPLDQVEIEKNLNEIHTIFQKATEITGFDHKMEHLAAIPTARGKALGLNHAAQCLLDYKRTVKFLMAVVTAIQEKQKAQPGKLINIFYAGCGPYAPFITLVAPLFASNEVRFSLLEINNNSLDSAKKLIQSLGLSEYVHDYYLADATTFEVPNSSIYHILISETLDALLYRECYVPILFNLLPQFGNDTILIPENVSLDIRYSTYSQNEKGEVSDYQEYPGETILDVRKAVSSHANETSVPSQLPDSKFDVQSMSDYTGLIIDTNVHVYKDIKLTRGESSLTLPFEMKLEHPIKHRNLVFTYQLEPEIELKYNLS